jgi:hypothetical protein
MASRPCAANSSLAHRRQDTARRRAQRKGDGADRARWARLAWYSNVSTRPWGATVRARLCVNEPLPVPATQAAPAVSRGPTQPTRQRHKRTGLDDDGARDKIQLGGDPRNVGVVQDLRAVRERQRPQLGRRVKHVHKAAAATSVHADHAAAKWHAHQPVVRKPPEPALVHAAALDQRRRQRPCALRQGQSRQRHASVCVSEVCVQPVAVPRKRRRGRRTRSDAPPAPRTATPPPCTQQKKIKGSCQPESNQ